MHKAERNGRVAFSVSLGLWLLLGCSQEERDNPVKAASEASVSAGTQDAAGKPLTRLADFKGKKIASLTGTAFDVSIDRVVPDVTHMYFNDASAMIQAVRAGKVAAWAADAPVARLVAAQFPDLAILPELICVDHYGLAVRKGDPLGQKASEVIARFKIDGTMKAMEDKWFGADASSKKLPDLAGRDGFDGRAGVLRFGHDTVTEPMSYVGDQGASLGLDVELAVRIAHALNMKIERVPMNFGALLSALQAEKVDMVAGCMTITEERKKSVDFTIPYYSGGQALLIKKAAAESAGPGEAGRAVTDLSKLATGRVGVMTGSVAEFYMEEKYPRASVGSYDNIADAVTALQGNKLDYVITAYTTALNFVKHNRDLAFLPERLMNEGPAIAVAKGNDALLKQLDEVLARFREDGTLARIISRWIKEGGEDYDSVEIPRHPAGRVLRAAVTANREPICFVRNNAFAGLDCELIERLAFELGLRVEFCDMQYSALVIALQSGKADVIISNMTPTKERREKVNFTARYFDNPQVALVKKPAAAQTAGCGITVAEGSGGGTAPTRGTRLCAGFAESFRRTFVVEDRYKLVLQGIRVTLLISALSAVFGTLLGFGVCTMRRARSAWLYVPAKVFIRSVQGTPIVVLLMILYYIVFGSVDVNAVLVAVVGFSINFAAYVSEMMRAGIDAVDKGQLEAAVALGFNRVRVFAKITFPQAVRHELPVFKGEFISMLKMTSVVGYIAIQDLTKMSDIIRSRTYEAFFPLIATALIYFAIAYVVTALLSLVELKVDPKQRKRVVKGVVRS
ncbi:MAG TPA: ABC transporter permease subunit [Kiritimatiellia bacterium]|nr:ABC transporter permease subunit [Kiritimatiellia bacterium]HPS07995.1 ABC transporter permease subunit [Kiritimatiellia bacterium]